MRRLPSLLLLLSATTGCATTHLARPVGRGNTRVSLSTGGPIAQVFGAPIPAPITTLGVAHGVTDSLDVHADLHPFAALFDTGNGAIPILGLDMGAAWHPLSTSRRALTLGGTMYGFTDKLDAVVFTDLWLAGSIAPTQWLSFSAGLHNVIRLGTTDPTLSTRTPWLPIAFVQVALRPFTARTTIDLEFRWYGFNLNGVVVTPTYYPIGDLGALGFLLGIHYQFPNGAP